MISCSWIKKKVEIPAKEHFHIITAYFFLKVRYLSSITHIHDTIMFQWNLLYSCELYGDRELNEISNISIFFVITLSNVLQGELLKCEELHQIAREAKDKFQQMQSELHSCDKCLLWRPEKLCIVEPYLLRSCI